MMIGSVGRLNLIALRYSGGGRLGKKNMEFDNQKGFTLIEVVAVLILLGILSAVIVSRMGMNNVDLVAVEAGLKGHVRYAQSMAMNSHGTVWGVRFDKPGDRYWLFRAGVGAGSAWSGNQIAFPGSEASPSADGNTIKTSHVGVRITGTGPSGHLTLVFDDMGTPYWGEGGAITFASPLADTPGLTRLSSALVISLADGSGHTGSLTITPETGFVQ